MPLAVRTADAARDHLLRVRVPGLFGRGRRVGLTDVETGCGSAVGVVGVRVGGEQGHLGVAVDASQGDLAACWEDGGPA